MSGTLQDGFELRGNLEYPGAPPALLLGYGVVRGAKMYFDVKEQGCREYDPDSPHKVNPAIVLTGEWRDANQYALYLIDERACLNALLGEPRLLSMAPDALRLELDDPATTPAVAQFARALMAAEGIPEAASCGVMAVIAVQQSPRFVPAPAIENRPDGTRLTSFASSLARFAQVDDLVAHPPGSEGWNARVADALRRADAEIRSVNGVEPLFRRLSGEALYGSTSSNHFRLSQRVSPDRFREQVLRAGVTFEGYDE